MTEIHYFPRYSQPENFVTNNTLLLLLRLNQYNRLKFQIFMGKLCEDQELQLSASWLHFRQQRGTGRSVLDGFISQDSLKIAVETKLTDVFDPVQLENHLGVFGDEQHKLLLLLSPALNAVSESLLKSIQELAAKRSVHVLHTSFEVIVEKVRSCLSDHDEEMRALVDDYESFCSDSKLLPRDKYTMLAPPCGESFDDNLEFSLYYCPTAYGNRSVEYLGIYSKKSVRAIGRIAKIVACKVDLDSNAVEVEEGSIGLTGDEERRIIGASRKAKDHGWDIRCGHKFYLCDELVETDFQKKSFGGIQGRRYFDLGNVLDAKIPNSIVELASVLRKKSWT